MSSFLYSTLSIFADHENEKKPKRSCLGLGERAPRSLRLQRYLSV